MVDLAVVVVETPVVTRRCARCHQDKPVVMFGRAGAGYQSYCKRCNSEQALEKFYAKHPIRPDPVVDIDNKTRHCSVCKTWKHWDAFGIYKGQPKAQCKECRAELELRKRGFDIDGSRRIAHRSKLKTKYGITPEQYDEMLKAQDGCCAICRSPTPGIRGQSFCVDHDHTTGRIRGLLCGKCNRALGFFGDSINILTEAIQYLKNEV